MNEDNTRLQDFVFEFVRRWRSILIGMLLGALLLNGFAIFRGMKRAKANALKSATPIAQVLSAGDRAAVDKIAPLYWGMITSIETTGDYMTNSLLMNMDLNAVPTMSVAFLIRSGNADDPAPSDIRDLSVFNSLCTAVLTDDLFRESAELLGIDETAYVQELFSVQGLDEAGGTPAILIRGRSEAECRQLYQLMDARLADAVSQLQNSGFDFECSTVSQYSVRCEQKLLDQKVERAKNIDTLNTGVNNMLRPLLPDQISYLDFLADQYKNGQTETASDSAAAVSAAPSRVRLVYIKYILAGLIAGAFVVICWVILRMNMDPKLFSAGELSSGYKLTSLGSLYVSSDKRRLFGFIDRWLFRLFEGQFIPAGASLHILSTKIRITAKKNNWDRIFLASSTGGREDALKQLAASLSGSLEAIPCDGALLDDAASLEKLSAADAVVLVEEKGSARMSEIKKELEIIGQMQIPVIGCATLVAYPK